MTMNFVTFNQDYSHLAIGMVLPILPRTSLKRRRRYHPRLQNIHNRSFLQMLRDKAWGHRAAGDALFNLLSRPHPVTKKVADNQHQSTSAFAADTRKALRGRLAKYIMIQEASAPYMTRRTDGSQTETIDYLRAYLSHRRSRHQTEPEETRGRPRGPDIPLRH